MPTKNPNGANQYQDDPRKILCWEYYIDPNSETFSNGTQSAIRAGYEPIYADVITTVDWFKGKVRRLGMFSKGETVLESMLDMDDQVELLVDGVPLGIKKRDTTITKIKQDTAKFVVETLGKDEGYAKRGEITGKNGAPFMGVTDDEYNSILKTHCDPNRTKEDSSPEENI